MKKERQEFRFSEQEKRSLEDLAIKHSMTVSDYIKAKVFSQNPDFLEEDVKYICPNSAKHSYFLALSQIRLLHVIRELFVRNNIMTMEEFKIFYAKTKEQDAEVLATLGYKKIIKDGEN